MRLISILLFLIVATGDVNIAGAEEWTYPVFKDIGPVKSLPDAVFRPDQEIRYRVLFDVAEGTLHSEGELNPDLKKVARYINTLSVAGIPMDKMDIALIVHGRALPAVLKNPIHRERFGTDNPNLKLIEQLRKKGVALYVCGLNLEDWEYDRAWVLDDFKIALSFLVVATTLQLKGFAYIPS